MARIRTIKPSFFTSETISRLTLEQRLTFIGLWTHVDDDGRCVDNARLIKAAIWPLDDRTGADVESDLGALTEHSLITRYIVGERSYICVNGFSEHQVINRRTKSAYPPPSEGTVKHVEAPPQPQVTATPASDETPDQTPTHGALTEDSVSTPIGKGREGKGKEKNTRSTRKRHAYSPEFEEFWTTYPKRVAKDAAAKAYASALHRATPEQILNGARAYRNDGPRQRAEPKFTKHPATWLNGGCWNDELTTTTPTGQRPFWEN